MTKLKDVAHIRLGMAFRSAIQDLGDKGDVYLIQTKDIQTTGLPSASKLPNVKPESNPRDHIIQRHEILIRLRGSIFAATIFDQQYPAVTTNQTAVITCNTEKLNPYFLNWFLNSQYALSFFGKIIEGSNIAKLSTAALKEMPIKLPTLEKQNQIANIYKNWQQQRAIHQQLIENGDQITKGICTAIYSDEHK